jgi:hypothetical protein
MIVGLRKMTSSVLVLVSSAVAEEIADARGDAAQAGYFAGAVVDPVFHETTHDGHFAIGQAQHGFHFTRLDFRNIVGEPPRGVGSSLSGPLLEMVGRTLSRMLPFSLICGVTLMTRPTETDFAVEVKLLVVP